MLGQFLDKNHKQYNIIILAGALDQEWVTHQSFQAFILLVRKSNRPFDKKVFLISHKIILGISWQADLLKIILKVNTLKTDTLFKGTL